MNWKEFRKNVGARFRLYPLPKLKDGDTLTEWNDYDWIVNEIDEANKSVKLNSVGPVYSITLGKDHIHSYMSDTQRPSDGLRYGILKLHVQLIIDGINIKIVPL